MYDTIGKSGSKFRNTSFKDIGGCYLPSHVLITGCPEIFTETDE